MVLSWYGAWLESQKVTLFGSSHCAMAPGGSGGRGLGRFSYEHVPSTTTSASAKPSAASPIITPVRHSGPNHGLPGRTRLPGASAKSCGAPGARASSCLLYTSDAADDLTRVDLGGRR